MIKGLTASSFDLLHCGHVSMLEECKEHCDYLVACLQTDPTIDRPTKNKPIQTVFERYMQLKAIKYVDEIIPYETEQDLIDILTTIKPDVRFLGEEYKDKDYTGRSLDISSFYNSRQHRFSSSELRRRIENGR